MLVDIYETKNKYSVIYTDPPWPQNKGGIRKCRPNQGKALDYNTMSLLDIETLHKNFLEKNTEKKHNVFCWAIDKYLHETEAMFERMGYKLHARMVWDKGNGIAPAFTVRFSHEYLLWFYNAGNMMMPCKETRGKYQTVIRETSAAHSKKPAAVYQMLEAMFPGYSKIELFARQGKTGWDYFGEECERNNLNILEDAQ